MSDNNGYISEWVPGPDGGMMHIYYDPNLDKAPELQTPHDEENDSGEEWIDTHEDGSVFNGGRRSWPGFEDVPW